MIFRFTLINPRGEHSTLPIYTKKIQKAHMILLKIFDIQNLLSKIYDSLENPSLILSSYHH